MSEEEGDGTQKVCEVFEPQAWRKGICKNCFQAPERHQSIANGDGSEPTSNELQDSRGKGKSASSIKDKYEQLERDKYKSQSPPKTLPRSKGQGNIAAFNENYGSLDRRTGRVPDSPSGNIPPPVFPKQYKKDGDGSLKKTKFGSVENLNSKEPESPQEPGFKAKNRFGSMENIADKKREPLHIPIQKGKFGGSSENISGKDKLIAGSPLKEKENELLNKLDSFQSEFKAGVTSKSGPTIIHKQKDGNVDVINLPPKDTKKDSTDNKLKSRFEKPELKSQVDDSKQPAKLGLKSRFDLKSPTPEKTNDLKSLKDTLSKAVDKKSVNNNDTKDTAANSSDHKTGRFNFKDQLKSSSPEKTPSSLKDRLKSPTGDTEKKGDIPSWKDKLKAKSPINDTKSLTPERGVKDSLDRLKSPTGDDIKKSGFSLKDKLKSPSTEKAKPLENKTEPENSSKGFNLRGQLKSSSKDNESSPAKTVAGTEDTKLKGYNRDQLLKSKKTEPDTLKSPAVEDKTKVHNFKDQLKLTKSDKDAPKSRFEKDTGSDGSKAGKTFDLRSGLKKKSDKEPERDKLPEPKVEEKKKAPLPSLRSSKYSIESKLKDSQTNAESKKAVAIDSNATDTFQKASSKSTDDNSSVSGVQKTHKEETENRKTEVVKTTNSTKEIPPMSDISKDDFEHISVDTGDVSGDKGDACAAKTSPRDRSPVHVDTQVFTSSRNKTAGVKCLADTDSLESVSGKQIGFSGLDKNSLKSLSKETVNAERDGVQNGDISNRTNDKMADSYEHCPKPSVVYSAEEIEKLKAELINMTERCQNLETENEILSTTVKKKESSESSLKKQKDEVENSIRSLQSHIKSMEEKYSKLEFEHNEHSTSNSVDKNRKSMENDSDEKEKIMEDMMDENEQLKQEINELKAEMEEMYDSFRDQEAEEFRELQKELEYTAKNCRVLQFKLRKSERKSEQIEIDKNTFEERLRKLQNQFKDRDAVSHIHSLEDELRVGSFHGRVILNHTQTHTHARTYRSFMVPIMTLNTI